MSKDNSPPSECEELYTTASMIESISNPTNEEILDAAMTFYDAAQCFDKSGDRKRAASAFTLAGEFYLSIAENSKAAECYGKAVLRNLMINDLEAAKIILDKGEEYGDIFDTFNFRMAKDSFNRQLTEDLEEDLNVLQDKETLFDSESLNYDLELPDKELSDSFNLELEEIDLSNSNEKTHFNISETDSESNFFISSMKGFNLTDSQLTSKDSKYSELIAFNLIKSAKKNVDKKVTSSGIGKAASGFIKDLEADSKFMRKDLLSKNPELGFNKLNISEADFESKTDEYGIALNEKLENVDLDLNKKDNLAKKQSSKGSIEESVTLESEFISVSEITADDDDLEEIEIHDSIPFAWQIKDIDSGGFELLSRNVDQETGSLIFTWKRDKLERGETARIQYTLRRRLQRSVVMISNKKVFVLNSFHSLEENENDFSKVNIEFENPYDETLTHLIIEDIIPDELKVTKTISSIDKKNLQIYSTKEGLTYRWIMNELKPKQKVTIEYTLIEKPFTRWFEQVFNVNGIDALKIEKIAEPLIEFYENSYVIFYELIPDSSFSTGEFILKDEIPFNAELQSSYPLWLRPTIEVTESQKKYLVWSKVELEGKTRRFVVKLKIKDTFNPHDPIVSFTSYDSKIANQKSDRAEGVIDLRKKMGLALVKQE